METGERKMKQIEYFATSLFFLVCGGTAIRTGFPKVGIISTLVSIGFTGLFGYKRYRGKIN